MVVRTHRPRLAAVVVQAVGIVVQAVGRSIGLDPGSAQGCSMCCSDLDYTEEVSKSSFKS